MKGKKFGIHGQGLVKRSFLNVLDFASAINILFEQDWKSLEHNVFNITSSNEFTVMEIISKISKILEVSLTEFTEIVPDRPFNDTRYLTNCKKLNELVGKRK